VDEGDFPSCPGPIVIGTKLPFDIGQPSFVVSATSGDSNESADGFRLRLVDQVPPPNSVCSGATPLEVNADTLEMNFANTLTNGLGCEET
jgi:hypothetical protein